MGKDVRVWGDRWLPTPITYSVQSPKFELPEDARVVDLIDQDSKVWVGCLISAIFHEEEAKVILNISLSPLQPKDRLIWLSTANWIFTVRSPYHLGMETVANPKCKLRL